MLNFANNGTVAIGASANAAGVTSAAATANADGLHQVINAATFGSANYTNAGVFGVSAVANATGLSANANAAVSFVVDQDVTVAAGTGIANLSNTGTLSALVSANASAAFTAAANANIAGALAQNVTVTTGNRQRDHQQRWRDQRHRERACGCLQRDRQCGLPAAAAPCPRAKSCRTSRRALAALRR